MRLTRGRSRWTTTRLAVEESSDKTVTTCREIAAFQISMRDIAL